MLAHALRFLCALRFGACALPVLAFAGCATAPSFDTASIEPIELVDVPFFPQTEYQCGPAALATILAHEGLPVDADDLAPAVYIEGLQGSLQAELLGATRRHGLIPYPIEPDPRTLFAELESGRPVLVLQNLGLERLPIWHYAVVVGLDSDRRHVLLRSGTERRRSERISRFLRSWRLAEQWAFVAVEPGELPATVTPERYVRALAGAVDHLDPAGADAAFDAAIERWPRNALVLFAAADRHAAARRLSEAQTAYEALLEVEPGHAAARNNLANVLAERGCRREALQQARTALERVDGESPLSAAIEDTVITLAAHDGGAAEPTHCSL